MSTNTTRNQQPPDTSSPEAARVDQPGPASIRQALVQAWAEERNAARAAHGQGDRATEWAHLERAHILSQPMAGRHVATHLAMLRYAIQGHDGREALGQVLRIVVAAPGTWTRRYPPGNTGGADVSAFLPMSIPDDLRPFFPPS
jgi:hypothetical protein